MKTAGIFVMIIGLILTIFTAVTYFTREKIVDIGSLAITADKPHHVYWSPWIGIGVMLLGGLIILISAKK
jgi:divalent metal cation (Fe/Co/Zn/Cd) transporter